MERRKLFPVLSLLVVAGLLVAGGLVFAGNPAQDVGGLTWTFETIGEGIKPALALDSSGAAHVAYLVEDFGGDTFYASNASGAWVTETVATGYFYGPVDIEVSPDGVPFIAYHDHQATQASLELGDLVVAFPENGAWTNLAVDDPGHDGWDSDIAIDANGFWHTAGIEPSQFGLQDGLEYSTNAFGAMRTEQVGSGPIAYEFGVSVETRDDGVAGISYFDNNTADLIYAERSAGADGAWTLTTVDSEADVGRYSSLAYDSAGSPHITYYFAETRTGGVVRHAWRDAGGAWQTEDIGRLDNVMMGFTGARKITGLEIDAADTLHAMYGDRVNIYYAVRGADGWSVQTVVEAEDANLGQLVEFALDGDGMPRVAFFDVTQPRPLLGNIIYGAASAG